MFFFKKHNKIKDSKLSDGIIRLDLDRVSGTDYFFRIISCENGEHMGYCDLRVGHNASLYYYGNIGYRVFPQYRGHCYAYRACLLLFDMARDLEMDYLLITVSPENTPSVKTCEKLHGVHLETVEVPPWHPLFMMNERIKRVYRFDLQQEQ